MKDILHFIPHTRFVVDSFVKSPDSVCNISAFFLTHWHYDHYRGLGPTFSYGPIYCSPTTARLLETITCVDPQWLVPKQLNEPFIVDQVKVTFLDANHCPGSVMILFQTGHGNYLHTGDMRFAADWKHSKWKVLNEICLDTVYLDTTYCHKKFSFPSRETTIRHILDKIEQNRHTQPSVHRHTLYVIATYGIGKERILDALVQNGYRMYCSPDKYRIMQCLEYWDSQVMNEYFTTDPSESPIWVVGWNRIAESVPGRLLPNFEVLEEWLHLANNCRATKQRRLDHGTTNCSLPVLQQVVALVPTGWTLRQKNNNNNNNNQGEYFHSKANMYVYGIPYSEHSNYEELHRFIAWLKPQQVIPTVMSKGQPKHPFSHLLAETQVKKAFLQKWLSQDPHTRG